MIATLARARVALRLLSVTFMRDQRGFTLIEVLVVLVLIGVLSGLAIAQYAGFRSRGFNGVYLSQQETRIRRYHEIIDDYIEGRRAQ